tara:strand:- start:5334 stop:5642 length:309 start_codon:yes stop_codon:yes gene_type:complete
MKLTKTKLKQLIKEELNEMSAYHFAGDDIATSLANKAAYAVVRAISAGAEDDLSEYSGIPEEDVSMLAEDIRAAVKNIVKEYLEPDVVDVAQRRLDLEEKKD